MSDIVTEHCVTYAKGLATGVIVLDWWERVTNFPGGPYATRWSPVLRYESSEPFQCGSIMYPMDACDPYESTDSALESILAYVPHVRALR